MNRYVGLLDPSGHSYDKYVLSSYNKPGTVLGAEGGGSMEKKDGGKQGTVFASRIF